MTTKSPLSPTRSSSAPARGLALPSAGTRALGVGRALVRELGPVLGGTAAIALIGQVALPLPFTPVPVTLGTFAALGVGAALGARRGAASAVLLAVLAAAGAPVMAGWSAGVGASFGYVVGYAPAAALAGWASQVWSRRPAGAGAAVAGRRLLGVAGLMLASSAAVYVPGLVWLQAVTGASWGAVLGMGLAPFIIGDLLKSLTATGLVSLLPLRRSPR